MKRAIALGVSVLIVAASTVDVALATKPGHDTNPNGFPSGEHYNLNIIGKRPEFTCPEQEYDEFGEPIYGNVIFVPQNGEGIEILMKSGRNKGKRAPTVTELQVIDPCTAGINGDDDAAVLQLPHNEAGYHVYARALATPTDNPWLQIVPELIAVEDEAGNDLMYLGLVTSNGFALPSQSFTRQKGPSQAINITGLFMWSGRVCYLTAEECEPIEDCEVTLLCCVDDEPEGDPDGLYESCEVKGEEDCIEGTLEVVAYCKSYGLDDPVWVFNIGDLVEYLWEIDNHGLKLLQVRFYPVE